MCVCVSIRRGGEDYGVIMILEFVIGKPLGDEKAMSRGAEKHFYSPHLVYELIACTAVRHGVPTVSNGRDTFSRSIRTGYKYSSDPPQVLLLLPWNDCTTLHNIWAECFPPTPRGNWVWRAATCIAEANRSIQVTEIQQDIQVSTECLGPGGRGLSRRNVAAPEDRGKALIHHQ